MLVSIVRRMLELSTFAQFFAVGTNQVTFADWARADPGTPLTRLSWEVLFGRFPALTMPASLELEVKSAIHCSASVLLALAAGIARSEPPRNAGMVLPGVWL